jgi:hypothetical protein
MTPERKPRPGSNRAGLKEAAQARASITRTEYRVSWRRVAWSSNTRDNARIFQTRDAAERFVARLADYQRRGLSPAVIRVSWRPAGQWCEGWPAS